MEVGITTIVWKQVTDSNQLQEIATYTSSCIGYCYNSKPNACTNEAFSRTSI